MAFSKKIDLSHLIHVIPDTNVLGAIDPRELAVLRFGGLEESFPPLPTLRIEEVDP